MNAREKVEKFKRDMLEERLALCDERQQGVFHKIFPKGVSDEDLMGAINLVDRTIAKNEKGQVA